jgi:hypothetical protein
VQAGTQNRSEHDFPKDPVSIVQRLSSQAGPGNARAVAYLLQLLLLVVS